jgi:hypothetical protein
VVLERWLGGYATLERLHQVLERPPDHSQLGLDRWIPVKPSEVRSVADASYADGATPDQIDALTLAYPVDGHFWELERDY